MVAPEAEAAGTEAAATKTAAAAATDTEAEAAANDLLVSNSVAAVSAVAHVRTIRSQFIALWNCEEEEEGRKKAAAAAAVTAEWERAM